MIDEVIANIPIVSTLIGIGNIALLLKELFFIKKSFVFVQKINKMCLSKKDINKHEEYLESNPIKKIEELKFIMALIDKEIDYKKLNIFLAYIIHTFTWEELMLYTDILSQITLYDIENLKEIYNIYKYTEDSNPPFASMLRLQSLGLVVFHDGFVR